MVDLVVDEQLVAVVDEQLEIQLLETGDPVQVLTVGEQGPPGPQGEPGDMSGEFAPDPLAYYILAKS